MAGGEFKQAVYMDAFYDKFGNLMVGTGGTVPIKKAATFKMGHLESCFDRNTSPPTIVSVPTGLADVPNVIYTGAVEASYANGRILYRCEMPDSAITSGPKEFSMLGLFDEDGLFIAMVIKLPSFLYVGDTNTEHAYSQLPVGG